MGSVPELQENKQIEYPSSEANETSTLARFVDRSTIHIDAAACIKWLFLGAAILIAVVALVWAGRYDLIVGFLSSVPRP